MVILKDSIDNLSTIDFNDATGSFIITGGIWTLFEHAGYTGNGVILRGRDYPTASTFVSHISSSRVLSSVRKGGYN